VFGELAKAFLLCLGVFSLILMMYFARMVLRDGVGLWPLLRILPNLFPIICPFVMPLAVTTAILVCYGRLSAGNETLAAHGGGIHPAWTVLPAFAMAVLAVFVSVTLNEVTSTAALKNIESIIIADHANILRRQLSHPGNIQAFAADSNYIALSRYRLDPTAREPSIDITFFSRAVARPGKTPGPPEEKPPLKPGEWDSRYPYPIRRILARRHKIGPVASPEGENTPLRVEITLHDQIILDLRDAAVEKLHLATFRKGEESLPTGGMSATLNSNRSSFWPILRTHEERQAARARLLQMDDNRADLEDAARKRQDDFEKESARMETEGVPRERLDDFKREHARMEAAFRKLRDDFEAEYARMEGRYNSRSSEVHLKLAVSFSCLAFAVLAVPMGMKPRRRSLTGAFAAGSLVTGLYFLVLKGLQIQVADGFFGVWVMWLPNAALVGIGLFLWWRERQQ